MWLKIMVMLAVNFSVGACLVLCSRSKMKERKSKTDPILEEFAKRRVERKRTIERVTWIGQN